MMYPCHVNRFRLLMVPEKPWAWRAWPPTNGALVGLELEDDPRGLITNLAKEFQRNWWKKRTRLIFLQKHNWGGESLFCIGWGWTLDSYSVGWAWQNDGKKAIFLLMVAFCGVNWGKISEVYSKRVYVKMLDQNITLVTFPPHSTPQILRSTELWDSQAFHSKVYLPRATVLDFAGFGGYFFGPPTHQSQLISRWSPGIILAPLGCASPGESHHDVKCQIFLAVS